MQIVFPRKLGFLSYVSTSIESIEDNFIVSTNLRQNDDERQHNLMSSKTIKLFVKSLNKGSNLMINYVLTNVVFFGTHVCLNNIFESRINILKLRFQAFKFGFWYVFLSGISHTLRGFVEPRICFVEKFPI